MRSQKPLRNIRDELIDCDWAFQKRELVEDAYHSFWGSLDDDVRLWLNSLLY